MWQEVSYSSVSVWTFWSPRGEEAGRLSAAACIWWSGSVPPSFPQFPVSCSALEREKWIWVIFSLCRFIFCKHVLKSQQRPFGMETLLSGFVQNGTLCDGLSPSRSCWAVRSERRIKTRLTAFSWVSWGGGVGCESDPTCHSVSHVTAAL